MSQSSTIAAFLLIGFLVYITAKGQLPGYMAVLFASGDTSAAVSALQNPAMAASSVTSTILNTLPSLIP